MLVPPAINANEAQIILGKLLDIDVRKCAAVFDETDGTCYLMTLMAETLTTAGRWEMRGYGTSFHAAFEDMAQRDIEVEARYAGQELAKIKRAARRLRRWETIKGWFGRLTGHGSVRSNIPKDLAVTVKGKA